MYRTARTEARPPRTIRFATHGAAVPVHRGHADEGGDLMARELAQFRERGKECDGGHLPDAGHAAQQIGLGLVEGTGRDGVLQVAIDVGQALLEPPDVLADVALDRPPGKAQPVLLGGEHVDDLAATRQQALEELRSLVREWAGLGVDPLGEVGQDASVQGIGLRQASQGLAENRVPGAG